MAVNRKITRIDKDRNVLIETEYQRKFRYRNDSGRGFSFPCDEQGNVYVDDLHPCGLDSFTKCTDGTYDVVDEGVVTYEQRIRLCGCGSGEETEDVYDARGIFLCRVCSQCKRAKLSRYRPDVLKDPNYWHDEPIDEDEQ